VKEVPDSPQREKILWLTVIRQAIWDSEGRGEIDDMTIYHATKWLTRTTRSFMTVCSLAGMPATQAEFLQEEQRKKLRKP
jgi:hypothetical protein